MLRRLLPIAAVAAALLGGAAPAAAAPLPGVQAHLTWSGVDRAEMDRQLDAAKAAGAGIVRVDVGWRTLEMEGKGRYAAWYLTKVDDVVAKAEARGLELLLTLMWTPPWASATGERNAVPSDPADYADALRFLVGRYGARVAAWEVWNEPNLEHFWKSTDPVGDYLALLRPAYAAAKAAHPGTTVVAGALSESDHAWTKAFYERGGKGHFDAWSIHPYSGDRSPLDPVAHYTKGSFVNGVPAVRAVMRAHGDDKPLWLTEFGWSTCTLRGLQAWANCVDEATQAAHLEAAFRHMATWDDVAVGVWYTLKNTATDIADRTGNRGLLRADGSAKPALAAFGQAAAALRSGVVPAAPQPPAAQAPAAGAPPAPTATRSAAPAATAEAPELVVATRTVRLPRAARSARVEVACRSSAGRTCRGAVVLTAKGKRLGSRSVAVSRRAKIVSIPLTREGRAVLRSAPVVARAALAR